jgi:hypothetical protein
MEFSRSSTPLPVRAICVSWGFAAHQGLERRHVDVDPPVVAVVVDALGQHAALDLALDLLDGVPGDGGGQADQDDVGWLDGGHLRGLVLGHAQGFDSDDVVAHD